jgi:hypothetical protein
VPTINQQNMKTELNIEEVESILKQFAQNASLGATEEWDDLAYEWLGQTLTIGYDKCKNEFHLNLRLAGASVGWPYDVLDSNPQHTLREALNCMVEECSEKIIAYGAEGAQLRMRHAMGC